MINLDNEEGVRNAFKTVAGWYGSDARDLGDDGNVTVLGPTGRRPGHRRTLVGSAAAALVLVAVVAIAGVAGRNYQPVAAANGEWSQMADAPLDARFAPVTLWTGSELLVWGGHDSAGTELTDGAAYDPDGNRWRTMAPFPFEYELRKGVGIGEDGGSTTHPSPGAWIDDKAVFVLASGEPGGWQIVSYDPAEDRWDILDEARFAARADDSLARLTGTATVQDPYAAVEWQGELLVFGWESERHEFGWSTFDVTSRRWSSFNGLPGSGGLYGATGPAHVTVMDDRYLVWVINRYFAGSDAPAGYSVDLLDGEVVAVERPERNTRVDIAELSTDGIIVGLSGDGETVRRFAAQLDPRTGTWSALTPPPSGSAGDDLFGGLSAMDDATALVGGLDIPSYSVGGLKSEAAELVLDEDGRWHDLPKAPINLSRVGAVVVWTGDRLIVWGGATTATSGPVNLAVTPLSDGAVYAVD